MSEFMLLLHNDPSMDLDISPETLGAMLEEYIGWRNRQGEAGILLGGEKLTDEGGKWLTANAGGLTVTDGPYSEAKEVLGGFFMIKADNYDEAVKISSDCPHLKYGGRIEVRQVEKHDDENQD